MACATYQGIVEKRQDCSQEVKQQSYAKKTLPTTNAIQNKRKTISSNCIGIHPNTGKQGKTVSTK
eukprot:3016699-Amphidinium_carterae.1